MLAQSALRPVAVSAIALSLAAGASAQIALDYPEGLAVPRYVTPTEQAWADSNPFGLRITGPDLAKDVTNGPPTGTVVSSGEYDPCEAIILAWEGGTTLNNIQRQMIRAITTIGDADVYVVFDTTTERDSIMPTFATNALSIADGPIVATNVARIKPVVAVTDTIWLRDYGPRFNFENGVRIISDHTYNATARAQDNALPLRFPPFKSNRPVYTLPLRHGGGNYHLNSIGKGYATQLINNENLLSTAAIQSLWLQHWGAQTTITPPFPTSVDGTQHIDMWMQIISDNEVLISDWPNQPGTTQDVICDNQAAAMLADGWTVTRLPARNINVSGVGNVHFTYANVVMANNLILIPAYTHATIAPMNAPALLAWQTAAPTKTIVPINADALAHLSGVMHCIVMQMPRHKGAVVDGGLAPTAFLRSQRAAATLAAGTTTPIKWISDDDGGVTRVEVWASTNGGDNWNLPLATITSTPTTTESITWTVPSIKTSRLRVKVVAFDADGRAGESINPVDLVIDAPACSADIASGGQVPAPDGELTADDVILFVNRFFAGDLNADMAGPGQSPSPDGELTADDIIVFVGAFFAGCA